VDINNLMGYLFKKDAQMDSARYYLERALTAVDGLQGKEEVIQRNKAMILHNLGTTYFKQDSIKTQSYYLRSGSLYQTLGNKENRARLWLDWGIFYQFYNDFPKADSLFGLCLEYGQQHKDVNLLSLAFQEKGFLYSRQFKKSKNPEDFTIALQNLNQSLEHVHDNDYRTYEILGNIYQDSWSNYINDSHIDSAIVYY
ncbi:MAG: hypothetical protein KDD09_26630, partial [Phaeodactylibacter sp.]|nr:hypothetical protein [Phaeodactylibacter sp.]